MKKHTTLTLMQPKYIERPRCNSPKPLFAELNAKPGSKIPRIKSPQRIVKTVFGSEKNLVLQPNIVTSVRTINSTIRDLILDNDTKNEEVSIWKQAKKITKEVHSKKMHKAMMILNPQVSNPKSLYYTGLISPKNSSLTQLSKNQKTFWGGKYQPNRPSIGLPSSSTQIKKLNIKEASDKILDATFKRNHSSKKLTIEKPTIHKHKSPSSAVRKLEMISGIGDLRRSSIGSLQDSLRSKKEKDKIIIQKTKSLPKFSLFDRCFLKAESNTKGNDQQGKDKKDNQTPVSFNKILHEESLYENSGNFDTEGLKNGVENSSKIAQDLSKQYLVDVKGLRNLFEINCSTKLKNQNDSKNEVESRNRRAKRSFQKPREEVTAV